MPVAPAAETSTCKFSVKAIDDLREQADLGTMLSTSVDGKEFTGWFASGIAAIPGYTEGSAPIEFRIEILKAYIQSIRAVKSASLVVRVKGIEDGMPLETKIYRGADVSTNWSNSESEIQTAFDKALTKLKQQIGKDLRAHCKR